MSIEVDDVERFSISEAAELLDRSPHTLRSWDRKGTIPEHLRPQRDANGNRFWTQTLIDEIKKWITDTGFHPGSGISYHPSPERLQQHIDRIRRSTRSKLVDEKQEALRVMITEAITVLGLTEDQVVAALPNVIGDFGIEMSDALRVASEVFALAR